MLSRMLRRLVIPLCLATIVFAKTPRPLASIPLHTPDMRTIDIKRQFRGHPIVLVIFSTACQDCVAVLHLMDGIQKEYGAQGLQVIGAAGDDNAKFLLAPFIARYRPTYPVGYISKEEIIKLADVPKATRPVAPIVMFIDKWGTVREQFYGDNPIFKDAERSLKALSLAMIKVTPVAPAAPKPVAPPKPTEPQP
jgi:peroxiredoxin